MAWFKLFALLSVFSIGTSINRPVYKIALTQKGFAQFLQYDIDTPPLREFTFCTWFRIYDLSGDQSIFTYVAHGNNRVVRLWLDSGSHQINVSINGKVTSSTPVEITKDMWRNVCLSYQSDHGAWALYMDSRLISCQASQAVLGFVLPGNGSLIVGYGTDLNGAQNGLEGEIFGTNMILSSTIERNYSLKNDPLYKQKLFDKNKMRERGPNAKYIVLGDLETDEVNNNFETTTTPYVPTTKSYIKVRTPYSIIEHEVGSAHKTRQDKGNMFNASIFFSNPVTDKNKPVTTSKIWSLSPHSGKYRSHNKSDPLDLRSRAHSFISQFEVPPPLPSLNYLSNLYEIPPTSKSIYKLNDDSFLSNRFVKKQIENLSEIETPPPIDADRLNSRWKGSTFASSVLKYLQNIQARKREQTKAQVPQTIPLIKTYDSFPYASSLSSIKVRAPIQFQRKSIVEKHFFESKRIPQINVEILNDDLRSSILKSHAKTHPKNVQVSNKGMRKYQEVRFYRSANYQEESKEGAEFAEGLFRTKTRKINPTSNASLQASNLMAILPFLKSLEYFIEDSQNIETKHTPNDTDIYTRSFSSSNKWHNVKSYSNDYTPREIKLGLEDNQKALDEKIDQMSKRHPSILLKYKPEERRLVPYKDDDSILKGRELASEVSDQSNSNKDSISILKYNHGFLPGKKESSKIKSWQGSDGEKPSIGNVAKNNFNKQVKLGNALNERRIIGDNVEQNKKSFVGGDERVPDINKFSAETEIKNWFSSVPGSFGLRVCKNVEFYDRVLYVKPDGSIDKTHIVSPLKMKTNIGVEFIMQNYKKCSLQDSYFQHNVKLFIDWSRTPVRLFGGAYPRKTTDLCGFFK